MSRLKSTAILPISRLSHRAGRGSAQGSRIFSSSLIHNARTPLADKRVSRGHRILVPIVAGTITSSHHFGRDKLGQATGSAAEEWSKAFHSLSSLGNKTSKSSTVVPPKNSNSKEQIPTVLDAGADLSPSTSDSKQPNPLAQQTSKEPATSTSSSTSTPKLISDLKTQPHIPPPSHPPHLPAVPLQTPTTPLKPQRQQLSLTFPSCRKWIKVHPWEATTVFTAVLLFVFPKILVGSVLLGLGFGSGGVARDSLAAGIQSYIGNVGKGDLFATLQSAATGASELPIVYGAVQVLAVAMVALVLRRAWMRKRTRKQ